MKFDQEKLTPALWLHFRGTSKIARLIQWAQAKWYKRHCRRNGLEYRAPWGNHDGLLCRYPGSLNWFCGEALQQGSVITPIEEIERQINAREIECRVYQVIGMTDGAGMRVCDNWRRYVSGTPYDWAAYPRLIIKTLVMDWEQWPWPFSCIGRKAAGWKWANWCTEGVAAAYSKWPPHISIINNSNPIPMHVEQVAGELPCRPPRAVKLRDITDQVIKRA